MKKWTIVSNLLYFLGAIFVFIATLFSPLFSSLSLAEEIYLSNHNGFSHLKNPTLLNYPISSTRIGLSSTSNTTEVQSQELIEISDEVLYLRQQLSDQSTQFLVIDRATQSVINEINTNDNYDSYYLANNKDQQKLYLISNIEDYSILKVLVINTQSHQVHESFSITIDNLYPAGVYSFSPDTVAYHPVANTLYIVQHRNVVEVRLDSKSYTRYQINKDGYSAQKLFLSANYEHLFFFISSNGISTANINSQGELIIDTEALGHDGKAVLQVNTQAFSCPYCLSAEHLFTLGDKIYLISDHSIEVSASESGSSSTILIQSPPPVSNGYGQVQDIYLSPDSKNLLILFQVIIEGEISSYVVSVDLEQGKVLGTVSFPEQIKEIIGFSSDGKKAYLNGLTEPHYIHVLNIPQQSWQTSILTGLAQAGIWDEKLWLYDNKEITIHDLDSLEEFPSGLGVNFNRGVSRMVADTQAGLIYYTQSHNISVGYQRNLASQSTSTLSQSSNDSHRDLGIPGFFPANRLYVWDMHLNRVNLQLTVGAFPLGLTLDKARNKAYVANCGDDSLSVIDLTTYQTLDTVAIGSEPVGVALSIDGSQLYVSQHGDKSLAVLDPSDHQLLNQITLSHAPGNLVLSANGETAYITTAEGEYLLVVDLKNQVETQIIPLDSIPGTFGSSTTQSTSLGENTESETIYSCFNQIIHTVNNARVTTHNRGISLTPDGDRVVTAVAETETVYVIDTTTHSIIQQLSYEELEQNQPALDGGWLTTPSLTEPPFLMAKSLTNGEIVLGLNLYDEQNILIAAPSKQSRFNTDTLSLTIPQLSLGTTQHQVALQQIATHPTSLFRLKSSQQLLQPQELTRNANEQAIFDGSFSLPVFSLGENNTVNIPELLISDGQNQENCKVSLKQVENEPFLFTIQEAHSNHNFLASKTVQTTQSNDCNYFTSQQQNLDNELPSSQLPIRWTQFWDGGNMQFNTASPSEFYSYYQIEQIKAHSDGTLWLSTYGSTARLNPPSDTDGNTPGSWEVIPNDLSEYEKSIDAKHIALGKDGSLWGVFRNNFATEYDYFQITPEGQVLAGNSGLTAYNNTIPAATIYPDSQNNIWIIGNGSPAPEGSTGYAYQGNTIAKQSPDGNWQYFYSELLYISYNRLHEDGQGGLWISQNNLIHLSPEGHFEEVITHTDSEYQGFIDHLYLDTDGTLWTAGKNGIAARDHNGQWRKYPYDSHHSSNIYVTGLEPDGTGGLWISTFDAGLLHFHLDENNNAQWTAVNSSNSSLWEDHIIAIEADGQGGLWIATRSGTLSQLKMEQ